MNEKTNLGNSKTDIIAKIAKSAVSAVPFAGGLLTEIVDTVIPNQRIDRLSKYIQELDSRLTKIQSEKISELITDERFIDLIEEGFIQASRATSDERRKYIASIIENGIHDEAIEFQDSKYLLKLLSELNDMEIIWLRFYLDPTTSGDVDFRNKHKNILTPVSAYKGADKETYNKSSLQDSYKEHLERLKLIESRLQFDRKTGFPDFDRTTGKPKTSSRRITYLGKMLLEQIGLII
nr:hypothetical protein [uncultured Draconibacterium sp.]